MNKELEGRTFDIPDNVKEHIKKFSGQGNSANGGSRAYNLLTTGKVTYGQLKRLLHDMKYMDKINNPLQYNLYGGDPMEKWGTTHLNGERQMIKDRKSSRKTADDIGAITGERSNAYLSSHTKKDNYVPPRNQMKSNSDKTAVSPIITGSIFEEINRIKQLMK